MFYKTLLLALRSVKPEPLFIEQLYAIYQKRRVKGEDFSVAIRTPLSVIWLRLDFSISMAW